MVAGTVSGELKQWHKITVDFEGPSVTEEASTFLDHRLDVTFTNAATGETIKVPGFFAADGDAANTSATSGNVWRVHFTPPDTGEWSYVASFRTGDFVAVSLDPNAGTAASFDGASGSISVIESDKTGDDLRAHGTLVNDGDFYLSYAGSGKTFIKSGVGGPENFLAFDGFDNTVNTTIDQAAPPDFATLKSYEPHLQDFNAGDPTWKNGEGQGIIGAVNYLSEKGMNSFYLMINSAGGDSRNVHPWSTTGLEDIPRNTRGADAEALSPLFQTYDVSKLAQWEIVFEHMQQQGINLQLLFSETENQRLLNDGELGIERMLYYREMVARFSHHNAVIFNHGEENTQSHSQLVDAYGYIKALDPYNHPVAFHTFPSSANFPRYLNDLTENAWDVVSFQQGTDNVEQFFIELYQQTVDAGIEQPIHWDEAWNRRAGFQPDSNPEQQAVNREKWWATLTNGGAGVSWYPGIPDDLSQEDFRTRDIAYTWTVATRKLWEQLPLNDMAPVHDATSETGDYVFGQLGQIYVIYLPNGGSATLNLSAFGGEYDIVWFNPRGDEPGLEGSVTTVQGGSAVSIGQPPKDATEDWAVLVRKAGEFRLEGIDPDVVPPNEAPVATNDAAAAVAGEPVSIDVLANDSDPEGSSLTIASVDDPTNGSAVIQNGEIVYTPNENFDGSETFAYTVSDELGATTSANVTVNVAEAPPPQTTPANAAAAFGSTAFDLPDTFSSLTNGAALIQILPGSENVKKSNFSANSFTIENTGDVRIVGVYFDVSTALYGDAVFDPDGSGGDNIAKGLTINTEGDTSVIDASTYDEFFQPTDNGADPLFADGVAENDAQGGFRGLLLKFGATGTGSDGFAPGEQVGLSIDMDPNSIAGFNKPTIDSGAVPSWDVGGISGAELIGSSVTVLFSDGTTATSELVSDGSQAGSQALVTQSSPELSASISVNDLDPGGVGTYADPPSVAVSGPAGSTIRVVLTKGIQPVQNDAANARSIVEQRLADEDFAANNAVEFQIVDVTLGAGETSRDISSLFTYDNNPNGFVFDGNDQLPLGFVASVIDPDNEDIPLGPVSDAIYLSYDGGPVPPVPADGAFELYLINADTDENLGQIVDGVIDVSELNGAAFSFEARLTGGETAGSVRFVLSTGQARTENAAPYALFGDRGPDFLGGALPQNDFTTTLTAYSGAGASGSVVAQETFDITLVDNGEPPQEPENTPPTAVNDAASTAFETAVSIDVLANDSDADGEQVSLVGVGAAQSGQTNIVDGEIVYTPNAGFSGVDNFSYTISDPENATDSGVVTVTVADDQTPGEPPAQDGPISLFLINADTDQLLDDISDGFLDPSLLNGANYAIEARYDGADDVGSIIFELSTGWSKTENVAPYALFGDPGGNYRGQALPDQPFTANVSAYTGVRGTGELIAEQTFDFVYDEDGNTPPPSTAANFIEFGSVTTSQSGRDQWHSVEFAQAIANAVVVMGPPSINDADPMTVRVRNVDENGFEFQMSEWSNLDGVHPTETIAWVAASAGVHELADGRSLMAGQTTAQDAAFKSVSLSGFDSAPVVLAQVSSDNDAQPVVERVKSVDAGSFSLRLSEEEAADQIHATETVDFIAIEAGTGASLSVGKTGTTVTHVPSEIPNDGIDEFLFLADMQSTKGADTAALRATSTADSASVFVEEETSKNAETKHVAEIVGFVFAEEGVQELF